MIEMPLPPCRVLAGAIAARLCPIEDAFDASAHPARCFRLRRPDRVQHLAHEGGIDRLNRQRADDREREAPERTLPLLDVLAVAPSSAVILDVAIRTLLERHRLGSIEPRQRTSGTSGLNWVYTFMPQPACVERLRAGLCEAVERERAEPHLPRASVEHVAIHPRCPALGDLEIKPAAVGIHAGQLRPRHLERCQSSRRPCHVPSTSVPMNMLRTIAKDGEPVKRKMLQKCPTDWSFLTISE